MLPFIADSAETETPDEKPALKAPVFSRVAIPYSSVILGLDPRIHQPAAWMVGSSPTMTEGVGTECPISTRYRPLRSPGNPAHRPGPWRGVRA